MTDATEARATLEAAVPSAPEPTLTPSLSAGAATTIRGLVARLMGQAGE
jgi:hypothetical protein